MHKHASSTAFLCLSVLAQMQCVFSFISVIIQVCGELTRDTKTSQCCEGTEERNNHVKKKKRIEKATRTFYIKTLLTYRCALEKEKGVN